MRRDAKTPEQYLAALSGKEALLVNEIRKSILSVAPEIEEAIRYGMLDYPGLANLGAQKRYVALYVAPVVLARHKSNFPGVDSGKSCLRFTKPDQIDSKALSALLEDTLAHRSTARSESNDSG